MAAGVLLQADAPGLVDSAGHRARHDARLVGLPLEPARRGARRRAPTPSARAAARPPTGCDVFQRLGGFDETLFAYWEDVDLALRFRAAGWRCALARGRARAAPSTGRRSAPPRRPQRRLEAFGRGYVLAKYRVARAPAAHRAKIAALDWPVLARPPRRSGGRPGRSASGSAARRAGLRSPARRAPLELATVGFGTALRRQAERSCGSASRAALPAHFDETVRERRQLIHEELRRPTRA